MIVVLSLHAVAKKETVRIDEQIGSYLPGNLNFKDENGNDVNLKAAIDKPTLLSIVYYQCPGICTPMLNSLTETIEDVQMTPGADYQMITISFDARETPQLAKEKQTNYLAKLDGHIKPEAWRFLTGDSANIKNLLTAVGFYYHKKGEQVSHRAGLLAVSPSGKITRYLHGIEYLPFDLQMALTEANEEKTGVSIQKIMQLCFSYDPEGRTYVLNITRVVGGVMLVVLLFFVLVVVYVRRPIPTHT